MSIYPGVSLITLFVEDLGRARAFYERLGWRLSKEVSSESTAYFALNNIALALHAPTPDERASPMVSLMQCHGGPQSLDRALAAALAAGATLVEPAQATASGGYAARFADPEGHVWEVACDARFDLAHDGSLGLPP